MILSFSDDERDIYNGILEVISNSKSLEWCNTFQDTEIQVGELKISLAQRSIFVNDIEVGLTNTEFEILYLLASNPGRVFTMEQVYNIVWNYEYLGDYATISKHISSKEKAIICIIYPDYVKAHGYKQVSLSVQKALCLEDTQKIILQ